MSTIVNALITDLLDAYKSTLAFFDFAYRDIDRTYQHYLREANGTGNCKIFSARTRKNVGQLDASSRADITRKCRSHALIIFNLQHCAYKMAMTNKTKFDRFCVSRCGSMTGSGC